jgi:hypothetical protein
MTISQDQFRVAIREAANEVTALDVPPLSLPADVGAGRHLSRRLWTSKRLLAPLAAAVAVIAVIATPFVLSGRGSHPAWPSTRTGVPIRLNRSGVPPYYLVMSSATSQAEIRDTATGATVATVRLPGPFARLFDATGAADNWTFVLVVYDSKDLPTGRVPLKYYLAQFSPRTDRVTLQRLPIPSPPSDWLPEGLALSPNGRELAIAQLESANNRFSVKVSVYSLATGQVQVWRASSRYQIFNGNASLSWSSTGMLAFNSYSTPKASGVWLLNTASAGGSLFSDSRLAVSSYQRAGFAQASYGVLTTDGRKIAMPVFRRTRTGVATYEFQVFSAATGKLLHVLLPRTSSRQNGVTPGVLWASARGDILIVLPAIGKTTFLELRGDRVTPIPNMESPIF